MFSNKALKKLFLPLIIEQILIMEVVVADTFNLLYPIFNKINHAITVIFLLKKLNINFCNDF